MSRVRVVGLVEGPTRHGVVSARVVRPTLPMRTPLVASDFSSALRVTGPPGGAPSRLITHTSWATNLRLDWPRSRGIHQAHARTNHHPPELTPTNHRSTST